LHDEPNDTGSLLFAAASPAASMWSNVLVLADSRLSAFSLLYAGGAYAALLGIAEIGLGRLLATASMLATAQPH